MAKNKGVVSIIIRAYDRTAKAFMGARRRMLAFGKAAGVAALGAVKLGAALGAVAAGGLLLFTRTIVGASSKVEDLTTRLTVLLGSVEKGNTLLSNMAKFASSVSFEFEEIAESATALAGVAKGGVEEVTNLMPIIADLAAASGLTIQETTGQMIRMMSAGAASADMFRERGILAMLGFQSGVSYTAEETMKRVNAAFEDTNSKFRGAATELAKNWSGMMSMMADRWFTLRTEIGKAGIFDALKDALGWIIETIDEWIASGQMARFAAGVSEFLMDTFMIVGMSIASVLNVVGKAGAKMAQWWGNMSGSWRLLVAMINRGVADIIVAIAMFVEKSTELLSKLPGPLGAMFIGRDGISSALYGEAARMHQLADDMERDAHAIFGAFRTGMEEEFADIDASFAAFVNRLGSFFDPGARPTKGGGTGTEADPYTGLGDIGMPTQDEIAALATAIDELYSNWEQRIKDTKDAQEALKRMLQDIAVNSIGEFADAWTAAWEAAISGAEGFGDALMQGLLGALAVVAKMFGEFFMAQAIAATGMGMAGFAPQGFAAAAKLAAAGLAMFALSGVLSGIAGGGGGGGAQIDEKDPFEEAGRGKTTIIFDGSFINLADPDQRKQMEDMIAELGQTTDNEIIVRGG